jgi:hypothetical protein
MALQVTQAVLGRKRGVWVGVDFMAADRLGLGFV